jgi:hypothetical protein
MEPNNPDRPPIEHWFTYRGLREQHPDAAERGRLMTAHGMAEDPDGRKRMEDMFGVDFCRLNYPEAYANTGRVRGVAKMLDLVRRLTPW